MDDQKEKKTKTPLEKLSGLIIKLNNIIPKAEENSDNKEYQEKVNNLGESLSEYKRKSRETEEELEASQETIKNLQQQMEKMKNKEKELRVHFNEQKNEIYALKKNFEVELESQKELYKQKIEDYSLLEREHRRAKQNFEKSMRETQKQIQIKEELFISNEESIKKD